MATTRLLCVCHSGFMTETVVAMTLGSLVTGALTHVLDPRWYHCYVKQLTEGPLPLRPEIVVILMLYSFLFPLLMELALRLCWVHIPYTRELSYQLFREYHEAFQEGTMGFGTSQVNKLCIQAIRKEVTISGLDHLYWKTTSGSKNISEAIVGALSDFLKNPKRGVSEDATANEESFRKNVVYPQIASLNRDGRLVVMMPEKGCSKNRRSVEESLGVKPLLVPSLGNSRRFLVVNRRVVVIGLDVPPHRDSYAANIAWTTEDLDRVHECLVEFDAIRQTYERTGNQQFGLR